MMVEVSVTSPPTTGARPEGRAAKGRAAAPRAGDLRPRSRPGCPSGSRWPSATVDLTLPQFRVLGILAEGSSAASGLADRLAVRRPSHHGDRGRPRRPRSGRPAPGGERPATGRAAPDRRRASTSWPTPTRPSTPYLASHGRPPARQGGGDGAALARAVGPGHGGVAERRPGRRTGRAADEQDRRPPRPARPNRRGPPAR